MAVTVAALLPAAWASGMGASLSNPATAGAPATRMYPLRSGGLLFPIYPAPTCEFLNNYREPARPGHVGTDIGATRGQAVYAVEDGELYQQWVNSGNAGNGWGLESDGDVRYRYFHLDTFAEGLQVGDRVMRGQLLGTVGTTGNAHPDGPHLHFEVLPGPDYQPVDPAPLLAVPAVCRIYRTWTPLYPTTTSTASTSTTSTSTTTTTAPPP